MRDPRPVGGGGLGRADVEAAEDLARVGRDDRGRAPVAMNASASRIASSVLPVAVAPATTMSGGDPAVRPSRADERAPQRVRPGVLDADEDLATDERARRRRGGRACCRASGRTAGSPARPRPATSGGRAGPSRRGRGRARAAPRRRGPRPRGRATPRCARGRSPPGARAASLSRRRLSSAGTSSARRVAGVPGPRRVGRGEDLVVADRLEQVERRLELRLGLAAEPDDDVGRDRDVRDGLADPRQPLAVVLDRCTGGPSGAARRPTPTGPAGGGARTPMSQSASAAISRSDRSHGCDVTKRRRPMAGRPSAVRRPSIARMSSARSGRPARSSWRPAQRAASTCPKRGSGGRSWPYELTFWPSSVTSR